MRTTKNRILALALCLAALLGGASSMATADPTMAMKIWDTGDALDWTVSATAQGAITIFMSQHPGYTWEQMQAQGYCVAPDPVNPGS